MKITGSGGGGKGGSGGGVQAQNTLQSDSIARIVEMLGEGEIVGLVNGAQSIYLNQTPLQNADGSYNFGGLFIYNSTTGVYDPVTSGTVLTGNEQWISGVGWDQRLGLPDQEVLLGFASSETTVGVEVQVKNSIGPVVRTIVDANTTSVKVVVRVPALANLDTNSGNLNATSVSWLVEVAPSGGAYVTAEIVALNNQKCTSPYQYQTMVTLPPGGAPWNIRVTRVTPDNITNANLQNETWWESYTEVVQGQFIYPNTALVSLTLNAKFFGTSIPARGYHVKGLKTEVPSNWDPVTRVYTGVWDGTFVKAWHNNPAWVLYALLSNDRWGLGEFINAGTIDKWTLYQIATYCDELVPSGFVDSHNNAILEPRFVFNGVINTREDAYRVLQGVAAAFRGMAYWSLGQVFAVADMPADPITVVSPANVIDGHFSYSGTAMKARHSAVAVSWNDPQDFYQPAIELVQNDAMIQRFGWRQLDVQAPGCTSRGQAHRFGKWILDTEQYSTETVEFAMSWDGYVLESGVTLKPGDIISVADPRKTGGARIGGRLVDVASTSTMTIDAPFVPTVGESYSLTVMMPGGAVETKPINSFDGTNTVIGLTTALSQLPQVGTMWVISGTDVNPRQYRVMSVQEQDSHLFKVVALFYDPTKFVRVEQNVSLAPIHYVRPNNVMSPPSNPTVVESNYFTNGAPQSRITLSWTAPVGGLASKYAVTADSPQGFVDFGQTATVSIDLFNITPGDWIFYIQAISITGLYSIRLPYAFTVHGWSAVTVPTAVSLALIGGGTSFPGTAPTIVWQNQFPSGDVVYPLNNIVRVYDTTLDTLLRTETISGLSYTYSFEDNINDGGPRRSLRFDVTAASLLGIEQPTPATITVSNPSPAAIAPNVSSTGVSISAAWSVTDNDYYQSIVWLSTVSGFDPLTTNPAYEGPDTSVDLTQTLPGVYYVRVGAYDLFGKAGMNIGAEVPINCTGLTVAALSAQLHDQVTTQFKAIGDSIQATQGIIASVAAEQDAANWLDKYNVKALLTSNVVKLNATMNDNFTTLSAAISTATSTAQTYADSAIAAYDITVAANYGTIASIAAAQVTTLASAKSYADGAIASYNTSVQTIYATKTSVSSGDASTLATANSNANSALAAYQVTVTATFATKTSVSTGDSNTLNAANATASSALAAYKLTVDASFANVNASVTVNANAITTTNSSLASYEATTNAAINGKTATITISVASPAVISWPSHGFAVGQAVKFSTTGALPTGLTAGVWYYVIAAGLALDAFELAAIVNGAAVNTSGTQSGVHTGAARGLSAGVTTNSTAVATIDGKVAGQYLVTLDVNGYISGIKAYNDGATANMVVIADNFEIASPGNVNGSAATVTISIATPAVIGWTAHGFSAGQLIKFSTTGALPTGLTVGVWYYVLSVGLTSDSFRLSVTDGGAAIATSGTQSGIHTATASGGGLPKPLFAIARVKGVPTLTLPGNMVADNTISAKKMVAGTIDAASGIIADLAVNTLQIAGQAVTVPLTASWTGAIVGPQTGYNLLASNITIDGVSGQQYTISIMGKIRVSSPTLASVYGRIYLYVDNHQVDFTDYYTPDALSQKPATALAMGSYTFTSSGSDTLPLVLKWDDYGASGYGTATYATLFAQVTKR